MVMDMVQLVLLVVLLCCTLRSSHGYSDDPYYYYEEVNYFREGDQVNGWNTYYATYWSQKCIEMGNDEQTLIVKHEQCGSVSSYDTTSVLLLRMDECGLEDCITPIYYADDEQEGGTSSNGGPSQKDKCTPCKHIDLNPSKARYPGESVYFGASVSLGTTQVVVGRSGTYNIHGDAYIYQKKDDGTFEEKQHILSTNQTFGRAVAFSPDESMVAFGVMNNDYYENYGEVVIYRHKTDSWEKETTLPIRDRRSARAIKWMGSDMLAVQSDWGLQMLKVQDKIWTSAGNISFPCESEYCYYHRASPWDASPNRHVAIGLPDSETVMLYEPSVTARGGWINLHNLTRRSQTAEEPNPKFGSAISFSGDGTVLAVGAPMDYVDMQDQGSISVFRQSSKGLFQEGEKLSFTGTRSLGENLAVSPNGNSIVAGTSMWESNNGQFGTILFSRTLKLKFFDQNYPTTSPNKPGSSGGGGLGVGAITLIILFVFSVTVGVGLVIYRQQRQRTSRANAAAPRLGQLDQTPIDASSSYQSPTIIQHDSGSETNYVELPTVQ